MSLKFRKVTRNGIKSLVSGERVTEHGITVERTSKGDLRWSVNVMVDGQRIHRVIGMESAGLTREQAERAIETLKTRAREGRLSLPKGRKTARSFAEAATDYLTRMEESGGKNMKAKRFHVAKVLIPRFGSYQVDRLTTNDVQLFVSERLKQGLAQATVNRELATFSHMYSRMVRWGQLTSSDIPEFAKGYEPRKRIVVLNDDATTRLIDSAAVDADDRLGLFVAFGLNTAMRHSEILKVRYSDVDLSSLRIFVPEAKANEREQPITSSLAALVREQEQIDGDGADWLFPNRNPGGLHPHRLSMAKQFKRAVDRAGLDPMMVTPHVMRHSAITRLVKAGVDLPTIQRISGHKTLSMVLRYVHVHGQHIDAAIRALDTTALAGTPKLHANENAVSSSVVCGLEKRVKT